MVVLVANRMCFSPFTVRAHVQRAMTELQARDRTQLVVVARQTGLADPRQGDSGAAIRDESTISCSAPTCASNAARPAAVAEYQRVRRLPVKVDEDVA